MRGRRAEIKPFEGTLDKPPPAPATVPKVVRSEWTRVVTDICDRGHLCDAMLPIVQTLVIAIWQRDLCVKAITKDGAFVKTKTGEPKPHPALGLLNKTHETIARLGAELGLTPASRSRKALSPIDKNEEKEKAAWAGMDI